MSETAPEIEGDKQDAETSSVSYGPGAALRRKREEYGWSVDAVADALRLPNSHIHALEEDQYDELPGSTYIIGYWRSYARVLGVDFEATIEANKRNLLDDAQDMTMTAQEGAVRSNTLRGGGGNARGLLPLLIGVMFLAAVVAGAWYLWRSDILSQVLGDANKDQADVARQTDQTAWIEAADQAEAVLVAKPNTMDVATQATEHDSAPESVLSEQPVVAVDEIKAVDVVNDQSHGDAQAGSASAGQQENMIHSNTAEVTAAHKEALAEASESKIEAGLAMADKPVQVAMEAGVDEANPVVEKEQKERSAQSPESVNSQSIDTENIATLEKENTNTKVSNQSEYAAVDGATERNVATTAQSSSQTTEVASGIASAQATFSNDPGIITLVLAKDSWLDVRDKTLKRLVYQSEPAGKTLEVKCTPPFYLYVGTPNGVEVFYQGKNVPFEAHENGLFARFSVGEAGQAGAKSLN